MRKRPAPNPDDAIFHRAMKLKDKLEPESPEQQELVLLRTKLEVRTWFLRVSLMFNMGLITGILIKVLEWV